MNKPRTNTPKALLLCLLLATCSPATAQPTGSETSVTQVFRWYPHWPLGGFYAGLGVAGALIVMFSMLGGAIPGTAGRAHIDIERARLDELNKHLSQALDTKPISSDTVKALGEMIDTARDDLRAELWRQYVLGAVLYTILGAFFASALAGDAIQAIVLGATWTSFLGVFGLKQDFASRNAVKEEALRTSEEALTAVQADMHRAVASNGTAVADAQDFAPTTHLALRAA